MIAAAFDQVCLRRGGRLVLDQVTLTLPPGAFIGLLGPNGAGKTTLLRALLGLEAPAAGRITVLGAPARRGRAEIGYLPQGQIVSALRGRDVVAAVAAGTGWGPPLPHHAHRAAVNRAITAVGAGAFADQPLSALSGGQRQLLLLAQALLNRPRLLLLDEPLNSLDPAAQAQIVAVVQRLRAELGCTVLFSSHVLNPLLPALDTVLYLAGGRAAIGPVDTVITAEMLSRLYRAPIEVLRAGGRLFVLQGAALAA